MSNNKIVVNGSLIPSVKNSPIDFRCRVAVIEDIPNIELPFVGMIVYVEQNNKFYVVKSLKSKMVGPVEVLDSLVDEYEELINPNFATEQFVQDAIANAQIGGGEGADIDLSEYATIEFVNQEIAAIELKEGPVGPKGDQGEKGEDGATPVKGVDYFTDEDKAEMLEGYATELYVQAEIAKAQVGGDNSEINLDAYATIEFVNQEIAAVELKEGPMGPKGDQGEQGPAGEDGATPVKGVDYFTDEDKAEMLEGYATEAFVQEEMVNKVDVEDGKSLMANSEIERLANVFNANYQFKINMIAAGEEASVSMNGDYPNIVVTFNIPVGAVSEEEPEEPVVSRMWYGIIPFDASGVAGVNNPDQVNENMTYEVIQFGLNGGKLIEADAAPIGKIPVALVKEDEGGFLCAIYPTDSNLIAYMDNGIGGKIPFTEMDKVSGLAKDACAITQPINDVQYTMDIMMITVAAATNMYIEEK